MEEEIRETGLAEKSGNRMVRVGVFALRTEYGMIWLVSDL